MGRTEIIGDAAATTLELIDTDQCQKQLEHAIKLMGQELIDHIQHDDLAGIIAPVSIEVEGKDVLGCVMTLQDRAILAWSIGVLRIRNSSVVVPLSSITSVVQRSRPGGRLRIEASVIDVFAERTWTLTSDAFADGADRLATILAGVLEGSITFGYGPEGERHGQDGGQAQEIADGD